MLLLNEILFFYVLISLKTQIHIYIIKKKDANLLTKLLQAVKQLLFNVLLFPDGGWLVDSTNGTNNESMLSEEILRDHQLEKLRKLCIPKIVLLLHNVMTEMNEHAECIQLADILVSEQLQLYKVRT
jgi:nuclear pore complex protein Nup107